MIRARDPSLCRSLRHEQPSCRRNSRRRHPDCGLLGIELRRASGRPIRPRATAIRAATPGVGAFHANFVPASGVLPYPTDLYFSGSTDGTLNWPCDAFPAERSNDQCARRLLDGRELDGAVLGAHQRRDDLAATRDHARGGRRQRDEGDDRLPARARLRHRLHGAGRADDWTPAAATLEIVPLKPLTPRPAQPTSDTS